MGNVLHGWSIDVEDWFHILDASGAPAPTSWDRQPARVAIGTRRMLDLLDRHRVRATFFTLGWIAQRHPDLVAEIADRGHEVGSHGHLHQLVHQQTRDAFARDLDASLEAIGRATGRAVTSFRAPGFSIGDGETWALPVLASRGITLDASFFLASHGHGGIVLRRERPFELVLADGRRLLEVPTVPWRVAGRALPFAGGGYLRLLPPQVLRKAFSDFEARGLPVCAYLHPRELDPEQPRMPLHWRRRFKYYVGLDTVAAKVDALMSEFRFGSLREMAGHRLDPPVHVGQPA
jgi:polysaccharide deacetylase family protein (PEP-CTERM system associated)